MTTDTTGRTGNPAAAASPDRFRYGFLKGNPQLTKNGELKHLLSIEGLPRSIVNHILDTAEQFVSVTDREVKKVPLLRGKSVFNLFFENSTRTRTTRARRDPPCSLWRSRRQSIPSGARLTRRASRRRMLAHSRTW